MTRAIASKYAPLVLCLLLSTPLMAQDQDPFDQTVEQLLELLKNVAKQPIPPETPEPDATDLRIIQKGAPNLKSHVKRQNYTNARRLVRSWVRKVRHEDLKNLCQRMELLLQKRVDQQEMPLIDSTDDLIESAEAACRKAKTSTDLDSIADVLHEFRNFDLNQSGSSRTIHRIRKQLDAAIWFVERWQNLLEAKVNNDTNQAMLVLNDLTETNYHRIRLIPRSELIEQRTRLQQNVQKEIAKTLEKLNGAITADSTLEDVIKIQIEAENIYRNRHQSNYYGYQNPIDRVRNTLQQWLAVLYAEEANDPISALQQLRNLQHNHYRDYRLIPASAIVAKRKALTGKIGQKVPMHKQIWQLLAKAKTAADLIKIQKELGNLRQFQTDNQLVTQLNSLQNDLTHLAKLYHALEFGRLEPIWTGVTGTHMYDSYHDWMDQTTALWEQALRQAIAKAAGLKSFEPQLPEKSPGESLLELADAASERSDWQQVHKLLDVYAMAFARESRPAWLKAEMEGTAAYLSGLQLENFGRYRQATDSYLLVLQQLGQRIPHKQAAARLEAIDEEHPESLE